MILENKKAFFIKICALLAIAGIGIFLFIPNTAFIWSAIFKNSADIAKIYAICGYLLLIVGIILHYFSGTKNVEVFTISIIVLFAFIKIIFDYDTEIGEKSSSIGPTLIIGVGYIIGILAIFSRRRVFNINLNIRDMIEIAMFCAMAIILDLTFFKIRIGQNGGSISLVMLPLAFMSIRKGFVRGFIGCGIVFGLLSCLIDGYGIITYPFDYLGAYGSIAIVGLFKTLKFERFKFIIQEALLAGLFAIAILFRLMFATISGMVLYSTPFLGSLTYNASYILPSALFSLVALLISYKPISKLFKRRSY